MNKELEEAIEFIKYYMKQYFYEDMAIEDDFKFEKAISIALNHIENSISKEEYNKIKEENEKLKKSNRIYINSIQNIAPILLEDYIEKEKVEETIEKIAISSLKYADFLPFRSTDYIFDISKFADTEGKTGAYLLYSTIRMKSLLSKAGNSAKEYQQVSTDRDIILTLLQLPSILIKSYEMKSLNEIADYLYTLTNKYNKFYSENRILTEENENLKSSWILLTDVVYHTNLLLFDILGLQVPEKM